MFSQHCSDIYYEKYYGRGGGGVVTGGKKENVEIGEKIKKGKEKRRKIA